MNRGERIDTMSYQIVGAVTLLKEHRFTLYSEHAAWTDYVLCQPQTVDLKYDGYWLFASFEGVLELSTFPAGSRVVGSPARACWQTQAWGLAGLGSHLFKAEFAAPWGVEQVGTYDAGCGDLSGKPILAMKKRAEAMAGGAS